MNDAYAFNMANQDLNESSDSAVSVRAGQGLWRFIRRSTINQLQSHRRRCPTARPQLLEVKRLSNKVEGIRDFMVR